MKSAPGIRAFSLLALLLALALLAAPAAPAAEIQEEEGGDVEWQPPYATSKTAPDVSNRINVGGQLPAFFSAFDWHSACNAYVGGIEPPDPHFAVGPEVTVGVNNEVMTAYGRNGALLWCANFSSLWTGFPSSSLVDPKVMYDPGAQRFYVALMAYSNSSLTSSMLVAVSKDANPMTGSSSSWWIYSFDAREIVGATTYGADYTCLGFDSQAIYVVYNMFSLPFTFPSFYNVQINALSKAQVLNGVAANQRTYTSAGSSNAFTLQPVSVFGSGGPSSKAYFVEIPTTSTTQVRLWALTNPLGPSPSLQSTMVTVPNHGGPITGAPQLGTYRKIDTFAPRALNNAFYYGGKIWFCHGAGGPALGRSAVFYYSINANDYPSTSPTLAESGNVDGGPGVWTFAPAIGCNALGDICMVYTQSAATQYPEVRAVARRASDPGFSSSISVRNSSTYYKGKGGSTATQRWGDYAAVAFDPLDNSFWVSHEFVKDTVSNDYWSQTYANLQFPPTVNGWVAGGIPLRVQQTDAVNPAVAPDGLGGAFVAWRDYRLGGFEVAYDLYMTHVTASGTLDSRWPYGGLRLTADGGSQDVLMLASDAAGGAYVAWAGSASALRILRVSEAGTIASGWPAAGVSVASSGVSPVLYVDASSNAFLAYRLSGIKTQKVSPAGALLWGANGVAVSTTTQATLPDITTDGAGGAIVSWSQPTNSVRAQRVTSAGTVSWTSGGVALDTGNAPKMLTDGAGGAFVAYRRSNGSPALIDLYATRVNSSGVTVSGWPRTVCNANQDQLDFHLATDTQGGFVMGWMDRRADATNSVGDIYAQRYDGAGNAEWAVNGAAVCTTPDDQSTPVVSSDTGGGILVTWSDSRGDGDIYLGRVMASGSSDPQIPANGVAVCTAAEMQLNPAMAVVSNDASVILAWEDGRHTPGCVPVCSGAIYAGRFTYDPLPPDAVSTLALAGGRTSLAITWYEPADQPGNGPIAAYDLAYSTTPINDSNFASTGTHLSPGVLGTPGMPQCVLLDGFPSCTWYYAAIKSQDAYGNWSAISNLPSTKTRCSGNVEVDCVMAGAHPADVAQDLPHQLVLDRPRPNPTSRSCEVRFGVPAELAHLRLDVSIFDVAGRRTRSLARGETQPGWTSLSWDLRDDAGHAVPAGTYFVRARFGAQERTERVVVSR